MPKDDMLTRIAMLIAAKQRRSSPGQPEWEFLGAEKRAEFQLLAFDILKELEKPSAIMVQCGDNAIRDAIPEDAEWEDGQSAYVIQNMILGALQ